MAGGMVQRWSIAEAWTAAVEVTASAYGVQAVLITAESRGRGPRPPREVWEAKKVAICLAVVLSECDYAALGRELGLHKDTVSSHCASVRNSVLESEAADAAFQSLETLAKARLDITARERLSAIHAHLDMLREATSDLLRLQPTARPTAHPTEVPTSRKRDQKRVAA